MFTEVISITKAIPQLLARNDDDFVDRLNHRHSVALFIIFALIVSTKQYVGEPITCWAPKHFESSHEEFANSFCWVKNTYYLPWDDYIPRQDEKRYVIPYYQWVPLFLLVQALMFYIPILVWRNMNERSGIDCNDIVETAEKYQFSEETEVKRKVLRFLVAQMDRYLKMRKRSAQEEEDDEVMCKCNCKWICARLCWWTGTGGKQKFGNYLVTLYMLVKILFLINAVGQLFLLNVFLGTDFNMYGIHVIGSAIKGEDWTNTERFPRVSMCDFQVRRLGNVHRYTVQCVLPINLFNEKIYLFVWFWLLFLCCITALNLIQWFFRLAIRVDRFRFMKRQLRKETKYDSQDPADKKYFRYFVTNYLRQDGVFVCRLIGLNTNPIILGEFVQALWDNYRKNPPKNIRAKLPDEIEMGEEV